MIWFPVKLGRSRCGQSGWWRRFQGKQGMTNWIETYRGTVPPWQCDVTEHFTIAYYFDRLEEAEANLADALGLGDLQRREDLRRRINARFARELREGAGFHVESAALGVADQDTGTELR